MKDYSISEIELLIEKDVLTMNPESITINDHNIYFVTLGEYFGFSALVFRDGMHIYYANDYQLHHPNRDLPALKSWYIETMKDKLYTDEMIYAPVKDYFDYENKTKYLHDYYPQMCPDKISAFNIFHNDAERREFEDKTKDMMFSPVGFFYSNDRAFIEKLATLYAAAKRSKEDQTNNYNYWYEGYKYEMYNHEYSINWDADCDTLGAFYNIPRNLSDNFYHGKICLHELLTALKMNDTQKQAYMDARSYVLANSNF